MKEAGGQSELAEAPHYLGHRERLRERFLKAGQGALADYELIELILFRAVPRRDVKPLAKALLQRFGSFAETIAAPIARLTEVKGIGEAAALELKIVEAAAQRLARGAIADRQVLDSWTTLIAYCRTAMAFSDKGRERATRHTTNRRNFNGLCRTDLRLSNVCPINGRAQRWIDGGKTEPHACTKKGTMEPTGPNRHHSQG
ncbi:hypothetical protein SAMN05519104_5194 [Rhizobiales bacterium GAS188]|nr:hypothetical protein SAMN05519104_5194 [Rhizobiales bacterium GAS188]